MEFIGEGEVLATVERSVSDEQCTCLCTAVWTACVDVWGLEAILCHTIDRMAF